MANTPPNVVPIPTFKQPIFDGTNTSRPWYFFFQSLYKNITQGITFTDGTNTVAGATKLTVTGGTVGGTSPNATLAISGGGSSPVTAASITGSGTALSPLELVNDAVSPGNSEYY